MYMALYLYSTSGVFPTECQVVAPNEIIPLLDPVSSTSASVQCISGFASGSSLAEDTYILELPNEDLDVIALFKRRKK